MVRDEWGVNISSIFQNKDCARIMDSSNKQGTKPCYDGDTKPCSHGGQPKFTNIMLFAVCLFKNTTTTTTLFNITILLLPLL